MAMTQPKPATNQWVGYHDLRGYLDLLEAKNLLRRITAEVELVHELGAITARSTRAQRPRPSCSITSKATRANRSSPTSSRRRSNWPSRSTPSPKKN